VGGAGATGRARLHASASKCLQEFLCVLRPPLRFRVNMSFGFSLTDFKEVIKISWDLYESLKECPQEIKDLSRDFATVYGVLNHVENDLGAKESAIRCHGEGRLKMLQTMILGLKGTIAEVQKLVDKFRPMAIESKKPEQLWLKLKWTVGQKRIKRVRQDLSFHISSFTLLMTSMGK